MKRHRGRVSVSRKCTARELRATIKAKEARIVRLLAELNKARALLSRM
jgi:hypothetical protein